MKKHIRIIFILVICLSLFPASVFASNKIKLTDKTYINTGSGNNVVAKFKTNKGYTYCITPGKSGPAPGTTLSLKNTIKTGGIVYLLDKAGTSDSSYLVTQLALWKYANNFVKSASSSNWNKANKLVKEAKKNNNYSTTPSVSIKSSSSSLVEKGDYYKSDKIILTIKNVKKDLKVKLDGAPTGSKIVDGNGNKKTSFKNGDVIYIYVPVKNVSKKTTFSLVISGVGYNTYVQRYASSNSKHQELLLLVRDTKKVSSSIKYTVTPVVRKCVYYNGKYYGKDGKVVDKTTYSIQCEKHTCEKVGDKYFGKDGKEVDKITFTKECEKHVCELIDGTYFGKDGSIVDSVTYDKECNRHVCEVIDNTYFGKDGSIVDVNTYKDQCEAKPAQVYVPDTADFDGLIYLIVGTLLIGGTVVVLRTVSKSN